MPINAPKLREDTTMKIHLEMISSGKTDQDGKVIGTKAISIDEFEVLTNETEWNKDCAETGKFWFNKSDKLRGLFYWRVKCSDEPQKACGCTKESV